MEQRLLPETTSSLEDQIRELGFDPTQLTPLEQAELLLIYSLCPDEALSV